MSRRARGRAVGIALCVCFALAAPAHAGRINTAPFFGWQFVADAGQADVLAVTLEPPGRFRIAANDPIDPIPAACEWVTVDKLLVSCPLAQFLAADLGDLADDFTFDDAIPMRVQLSGGAGNDELDGGALGDSITGGSETDTIMAGPGDDHVTPGTDPDAANGEAGSDTISFFNDGRSAGVVVLLEFSITGPDGDAIPNFENVQGTDFVDDLTGTGGDNVLTGFGGDDELNDGGGGRDTLSYLFHATPLMLNLVTNANNAGDMISGQFEGVVGGSQNDILNAQGASFSVTLDGAAGNDLLLGGNADDLLVGGPGQDQHAGSAGADTASYRDRDQIEPVNTSLTAGEPQQDGDTYDAIENLEGGAGADILRGDAGPNSLIGGDGTDTLVGGGGADALFGNDTAGSSDGDPDTAGYDDGRTSPVITELAGAHQDGDFYSDIQNLTGGDGNDLLVGDGGVNVLIGNNGADILVGGGGPDDLRGGVPSGSPDVSLDVASYRDRATAVTAALGVTIPDGDVFSDIGGLEGGSGPDTLTGDAGANLIVGGVGADTITGAAGRDDLQAGDGDDNVQARDGEIDTVDCGAGRDVHVEDASDRLTACEDLRAPNTRITQRPRRTTRNRRALFRLASTERGSTFQCKLDRGRWRRCTARPSYRPLRRGRHIFRARARDRAGNVDRTPAVYRWRIRR